MCPAGFAERLERSTDDTASPRSEQAPASTMVVGAADDYAEREADRVAGEVIARLYGGAGDVHVHSSHCGHGGEVRRSATTSGEAEVGHAGGAISEGLSSRIESKRGGGSALPGDVRRRLEDGFGGSLANVRIHTDGESASLNRAVAARAFTTGNDIFFGAGEFRPETPEGEHMLAHEVAHTRQQGGGARRTAIRRWDLKSKNLGLGQAADISTLKSRPIWFVKDEGGDQIVVKSEDQPVGLGQLAATLHKKVSGIKSVKTRKLEWKDRLAIDNVLEIKSMGDGLNKSWSDRGDQLKASDPQIPATDESADVAKADAQKQLWDKTRSVVAMTVAEGEGADQLADVQQGKGAADDDLSRYRAMLLDENHMRKLGQMAAVDLFYGNQDRLITGNFGNWFVKADSPDKELMLLDHVDPGMAMRLGTAKSFDDLAGWAAAVGNEFTGKSSRSTLINPLLGRMDDVDGSTFTWVNGRMADGRTRKAFMLDALDVGFVETAKRIVKIFSTTRWSLTSLKAHSAKKSIRSAAKSGATGDGQGVDRYYQQLKDRAGWIKTNLG